MFRVFTAMLFAVAAVPAFAQNEVVVYHNPSNYDSSDGSVSTAACAAQLDPPFTTFGEIPIYPYLAGASFVNSSEGGTAECGTCWQLTSANGSVVVLIVDQADNGFNVGEEAFNDLTVHGAFKYYSVNATATQIDESVCGLSQTGST